MSKEIDLSQFYGSLNQYRYGRMLLSDGVHYLANEGECFWLIDAIASYQHQESVKSLGIQFWHLAVHEDRSATLTCVEDSGIPPVVKQEIPFTDFPLPEIDLWVEGGNVIILSSEH